MSDQQSEIPDHQSRHRRPTFDRFATRAARWMGHGLTFGIAVLLTLGWAVSGPIFHATKGPPRAGRRASLPRSQR